MTSDDRTSILERITKLFRLADSGKNSSEAEVLLAMTRAKELMAKYNIAMSEINPDSTTQTKSRIIITDSSVYERRHAYFTKYERWLGRAVATLTSTKIYFNTTYRNGNHVAMHFFGDTTDVAVAQALFPILLKTVRRMAHQTYGKGWTTEHRNYSDGFTYRLIQRAREMKIDLTPQQQNCLALVLKTKETAIEEYATKNLALREMKRSTSNMTNSEAFNQGYSDGGSVNLNSKGSLKS